MSRTSSIPLIARSYHHGGRAAILDAQGSFTYDDLLNASSSVARAVLDGREDLHEERIAFALTPGFPWVATQWGIWKARGIAVPLPLNSPRPELEYFMDDTGASVLVCDEATAPQLSPIAAARGIRLLPYEQLCAQEHPAPEILSDIPSASRKVNVTRRAMILYTSGTTSRPKGVVTTHANIAAQITSLIDAWEWSEADRILLCLPLHHVHGIINVLSCSLWAGATCEMLPRFDADTAWDRIAEGKLTLFMAVPTVYAKLIAAWEAASPERRALLSQACRGLRLMVSGSAALPAGTLQRWKEISGHTLLERYGMTEIGMALSNPLHGDRVAGSVGKPLPGVKVRLVSDHGNPVASGHAGEIEVRGASVFAEYWRQPEATRAAFHDGWFRTGDMAVVENGAYRILGRTSIDILKTGGHKVSALEIEEVLRQHPAVAECAVVGVPDAEWGELVAAAIVPKEIAKEVPKTFSKKVPEEVSQATLQDVLDEAHALDLSSLRAWAKQSLAVHKVPSRLLVLDELPRNAMGKVIKPAVVALFQNSRASIPPARRTT